MPIMSLESNGAELQPHRQLAETLPPGQYVVGLSSMAAGGTTGTYVVTTSNGFEKKGLLAPKQTDELRIDGPTELKVENLSDEASIMVRVSPLAK